jgi:hypothetical protein
MTALQSAVVNHEAETYSLFRRVCPDCHRFRPVKDYAMRQIRTVLGIVEVRNPRWMLCRDCYPGAGRPMHTMSHEFVLVAGRLCDSPGCAESVNP